MDISKNNSISDSGCTIHCLPEKYPHDNKIHNAKVLRATQPKKSIIKSNYKYNIKV